MTNKEKYLTLEEQLKQFKIFCDSNNCDNCVFGYVTVARNPLYGQKKLLQCHFDCYNDWLKLDSEKTIKDNSNTWRCEYCDSTYGIEDRYQYCPECGHRVKW